MRKNLSTLLTGFLFLFPIISHAGEVEDNLVERLVETFGGEPLLNPTSFVIKEQSVAYLFHGGVRPGSAEPNFDNIYLTFDGATNSYSYEHWVYPEGGEPGHTYTQFNGDSGFEIDFRARDFEAFEDITLQGTAAFFLPHHPVLLVREIHRESEAVTFLEETEFKGHLQKVIRFDPSWFPPMTIFIDSETNYLTKMEWTSSAHQVGKVTHFYDDYFRENGVLFAGSFTVKAYSRTYSNSLSKEVLWNEPVSQYFVNPDRFQERQARQIETPTVTKISEDTYLVGSGIDFTVFVLTGEGLVGFGSRRGLKSRLDQFRQATGISTPWAYQIIDHHHADHLWGLNEIWTEAPKFITAEPHVLALRDSYEGHLNDARIVRVIEKITLDGAKRVEVYDISTVHSDHNLVAYLPDEKRLLVADHYFLNGRAGPVVPYPSVRSFAKALEGLGLEVEEFITIHNGRIIKLGDFNRTLVMEDPPVCFENRLICARF